MNNDALSVSCNEYPFRNEYSSTIITMVGGRIDDGRSDYDTDYEKDFEAEQAKEDSTSTFL
jgi:hypothetical protein